MGHAARATLESLELLLRARKLDRTLAETGTLTVFGTDVSENGECPGFRAPTGIAALDTALGGGLRRGQVSEIAGPRSAGRTHVLCASLAAATGRGELVALVDACDRFDPASAAAAGVDLGALLWIRESGDVGRSLKAMNLVLQAGGFGVVALDLSDVPSRNVRQVPYTTWIRLARVIEGSQTAALVVGSERITRSPGGVTIALEGSSARWTGGSHRSRLLHGVVPQPRVIGARG